MQRKIVDRFIELRDNGGYALVDPDALVKRGLTELQASIVNLRLHPDSRLLDNKQVAEIVGCSHESGVVCRFLGSPKYFDTMASVDVVPRRVMRVEDKAWCSLEKNVEDRDTPSIKLAFQLAGRLDQVDNKTGIAPKELHLHVHASLAGLLPKDKQEIEEAEFEVEE
jgi:hypothetical protein